MSTLNGHVTLFKNDLDKEQFDALTEKVSHLVDDNNGVVFVDDHSDTHRMVVNFKDAHIEKAALENFIVSLMSDNKDNVRFLSFSLEEDYPDIKEDVLTSYRYAPGEDVHEVRVDVYVTRKATYHLI
mgnify:FL=1